MSNFFSISTDSCSYNSALSWDRFLETNLDLEKVNSGMNKFHPFSNVYINGNTCNTFSCISCFNCSYIQIDCVTWSTILLNFIFPISCIISTCDVQTDLKSPGSVSPEINPLSISICRLNFMIDLHGIIFLVSLKVFCYF